MKQTKLIHFNDTKKDLLFWVKRFLADKIANVSTAKTKDDFDMAALVQAMLKDSTDSIDKVMDVSRLAWRQGLDGLKKPSTNIEKFYRFIKENVDRFPALTSISIVTVKHFAEKSDPDAKKQAKDAMFDVPRNFFNFIDGNTIKGEHRFNITKGERGRRKHSCASNTSRRQNAVYLTEDEMRQYNKAILKIKYRDELERNRDILLGRILLFSGITVNELIALRDEDFIDDDVEPNDTVWLHMHGKGAAKRKIPMPKRKLIVFLNAYKEGRGDSENGCMFYSPIDPKKEITDTVIRGILKRQFKAAGLPEKKATPMVMRNSFGIFIYRQMYRAGNPNADRYVQNLMGHADVQTTRNLVKADGVRLISAADVFGDFVDK